MNRFLVYLIILGLTLYTVLGDSFIKRAGNGSTYVNWKYLLLGLLIYSSTTFIWFFVYKQVKFSIAGTVYGVITALVFALAGVFYFKESISFIEIIGIIMAIASILILGRFN